MPIARGGPTTSVTTAVWLTTPLVPVIVNRVVPEGVNDEVHAVRVVLPPVLTEAGLNIGVVAAGAPVSVIRTVPVNPLSGVMVIV
jgi:hypothetical protein